ncbi:hypothetical protein AKJ18_00675 [Vibrio xuii]|nr:hypothetical protein AKJ18_00675 [Vibrio xuii]
MLSEWFQLSEGRYYWLADAKTHQQAVKESGFGFDDSVPLFSGPMFESAKALSPWLVPVSDQLLGVKSGVLDLGIGIQSNAEFELVLEHLRSILLASYEGEEVMFRFYDKQVIGPMLLAMEESEINSLLGNIDQLAIANDSLACYVNSSKAEFILNTDTWWKVQPHHLTALYNENTHAKSIERRWWNLFPEMMERLTNPNDVILAALKKAKERGYPQEQMEACALVEVTRQTQTHLSELSQPFHLNLEELKELETLKEVWT